MQQQELVAAAHKHPWQLGLIGGGIALLVIGAVAAYSQTKGEQLVISEASESVQTPQDQIELVVDVEGAVEKPGVYRLKEGARIGEAIIAAGGLAAQADRSWVARFVNQAEKVRDGAKLFIPAVGEKQVAGDKIQEIGNSVVISINTASQSELESLWGIGEARSRTIMENRPYSTLEELVTKAKVPRDVIDKNDGKIGL